MYQLLKTRRSIRKFSDKEIEQQVIDEIIKGALMSPSSKGKMPWELVLVKDKDMLLKLSNSKEAGSTFIKGAALAIVLLGDKEVSDVWIEDVSIVGITIQYLAQSKGLGSCWVQIRNRYTKDKIDSEAYVKDVLNIPDKYGVDCMIALGYPDEEKSSHEEETLLFDKIHLEKFSL